MRKSTPTIAPRTLSVAKNSMIENPRLLPEDYIVLVKNWIDIVERPDEFGAEYRKIIDQGYKCVFPQFDDGTELQNKCLCGCEKMVYYFKKV
jgi:hypothetical protein